MRRGKQAFILFLILVSVTFLLLWLWQGQLISVESGERLKESGAVYFLKPDENIRPADGRERVKLYVPETFIREYTLVIFRSRNFYLYVPGSEEPTELSPDNSYRRLQTLELTSEMYDDGVLTFEWSAGEFFLSRRLYLIPKEALANLYRFYGMFQYVLLGMFFLMLVYSLHLYACKRDEHYLLYFSIFISSLLLMMVINITPLDVSIPQQMYIGLQPFLTMLQVCLGLLACFDLLDYPRARFYRMILSGPGIFLTCLCYGALTVYYGGDTAEFLRLPYLILFTFLLIRACGEGYRGAGALLAGHSIKMGIILMQFCVNIGLLTDWIDFIFLRSALVPELPFAFACMLCINRRFADKFKDSEVLTAELADLNQQLDRQVEKRTRQYQEQMERRHNMMLNVFHDLRTPLFTLTGCMDILSGELPGERELVDVMKQRLAFATELTENLFLLAKLEDNEWMIPFGPLTLEGVLEPICKSLKVEAEKNSLEMEVSYIPPVQLWGNREQLQRAFQNFITNAIHYTPVGGRVGVICSQEGENVMIRISDTGKGMDEEALSHLFTRYYRSETHGSSDSTGLGLSIAKNIIDRHKGEIRVSSSLETGTVICVMLPVVTGREDF
ncbi:MAG: hypothetical protein HFI93_03310 [Lachnospiraceae bacterium]|nr:hypothetical protein [Lachnospiraceae bacterium]